LPFVVVERFVRWLSMTAALLALAAAAWLSPKPRDAATTWRLLQVDESSIALVSPQGVTEQVPLAQLAETICARGANPLEIDARGELLSRIISLVYSTNAKVSYHPTPLDRARSFFVPGSPPLRCPDCPAPKPFCKGSERKP
jgi:hypothetical protein